MENIHSTAFIRSRQWQHHSTVSGLDLQHIWPVFDFTFLGDHVAMGWVMKARTCRIMPETCLAPVCTHQIYSPKVNIILSASTWMRPLVAQQLNPQLVRDLPVCFEFPVTF